MIIYYLISTAVCAAVCYLCYLKSVAHNYWARRNVPHLPPSLLVGNYGEYVTLRKHGALVAHDICRRFPGAPYVGAFYGTSPALLVRDPDLVKAVLAKDFYHFSEREVSAYTDREPITRNMFFTGGDRWRVLRQNLTSLFSSSKLKNMFYLIENCASSLESVLDEVSRTSDSRVVEIKSLLSRYTMDCIGSCAFGINTGALRADSQAPNPFVSVGDKIFDATTYGGLMWILRAMWPAPFYRLGFQLFSRDVSVFFNELITGVFEKRQHRASSRNDFVDEILGWKKNSYLTGDSITNMKTGEKVVVKLPVDDELLVAQCVLFFAAGFETTATTTSFLLYELAKHPHVQERVKEEVAEYFRRHDGKIEFECINEMPYLQACIDETLRLYPVLGVLTREVTEEYTLPTGLLLERGTRVHIPVYHMHHNPEYFPDPEAFRPERFYGEARKNIKRYTYLPFGEGPRICIGLRFARMPMVAALLGALRRRRVRLAADAPRALALEPRSLVTRPRGALRLQLVPDAPAARATDRADLL